MANKPLERYFSPRTLADDIEHWLADEPVSAWTEPWTVKTRRWLGITASVLGLIGGLALRWAITQAGHASAADPQAARDASQSG